MYLTESGALQKDSADTEAIAQAQAGNADGFRVLVERHGRAIYNLAFRMTGNQHDAEDLVQETFLRACKQLHRFDGRASIGTWLYRIASNCSVDLLRSRQSRERRIVNLAGPAANDAENNPERNGLERFPHSFTLTGAADDVQRISTPAGSRHAPAQPK